MTALHARQPQVLPRPASTPTAIRAVLAANADGDILQRYDEDLDAVFEQAREQGDVTPLVRTVKRWWFEADAWRDPKRSGSFSRWRMFVRLARLGECAALAGPSRARRYPTWLG
jgi:hypothetical protein